MYDKAFEEKADLVIADLPCSGLGVLGKKADLRYKASPEGAEELVKLQRRILSCVQRYVKPGGVLLYSTCTVNPAENIESVMEKGCIQLLPGIHKCDGFFIARLVKRTAQE